MHAYAGVWNTISGPDGCLQAVDLATVEYSACADGSTAQQWRLVEFEGASWNAVESMRFPGMCVVRSENGNVTPACSCAEIALKVRPCASTACDAGRVSMRS